MSKQYEKLAADILEAVGGKQNVVSLRHCITRLRFVLKNEKLAKTDALKQMPGVATVVVSAGEYMVVIGVHVHEVFEEVCAHMGVNGKDRNEVKLLVQKKSVMNRVMDVIMGAMGPTLNLLCACGIIKGLLVLLSIAGVATDGGIYLLLNAAGDSFFYFMPMLLAYNVARKLDIDPVFGFVLAAALCYPAIQGVDISLFGYVANATYTGTFLPAILGVVVAAPIYKFLNQYIPGVIKGFMVPLITLLIAYPLTFLVVGPVSNLVSMAINVALTSIMEISPVVAGILVGGLYQVLVLFGVHGMIGMVAMMDLLSGNPSFMLGIATIPPFAVAGAILAVYLRSKDKKLKGIALPAFISAVFGVTEPSLYGILLPNLPVFVAAGIGGAAGGLIMGMFGLKLYTFAGMGIVGLLGFIDPAGSTSFAALVLMVLAAFFVAFVLTLVLFKDHTFQENMATVTTKPQEDLLNRRVGLKAPAAGKAKPLSDCVDEAFSGEALGKGCVILPSEGKVYSPCDGKVCKLFPTNHAIGLVTEEGVEVLIHIGIDTISLNGKFFESHVKEGDRVKTGQLLITFDKAAVEDAGYNTEMAVIITNTDDYLDVVQTAEGSVQLSSNLLTVLM